MSMKCAQCGTRLVPGTLSCANCGQQFATPVPPDPTPVQAAAAPPPPQAPYGQAPQAPQAPYGQAPQGQYGQAPQGQYGQAPMGGPTPGPAGPVDPVKKYGPWVAAVVVAGFAYNHFSKPATPPAPQPTPPVVQPTQPQQPVQPQPTDPNQPQQPPVVQPVTQPTQGGGDSQQAIVDNIKRVIAAKNQFVQLVQSAKENDPNEAAWLAAMQQNTQELKAAADQGSQLQWPAQYAQAQGYYREACGDFSFVGDHWITALQAGDKAGADDCVSHFKAGDNALTETKSAIDAVGGGGGSQNAMKGGMQSGLSASIMSETKTTAPLTYHFKK